MCSLPLSGDMTFEVVDETERERSCGRVREREDTHARA